jgi:hypothetical protein
VDFRITDDFADNPKVERLVRMLDESAIRALLRVFGYTARNRPDGNLTGLTGDDIEIIARWSPRRKGRLIAALVELNFLEQNGPDLLIHNWLKRQPYLADRDFRSARAKKAAQTRWNRHSGASQADDSTMLRGCSEHTDSMLSASPNDARSNARIDPDRIDPKRERTLTPKGKKRKPETTWPDGFTLSDSLRTYAVKHGFDADHEFEKFHLHAIDKSPTHKDWSIAFKRWIQNAVSYREKRSGNGKPQIHTPGYVMNDDYLAARKG